MKVSVVIERDEHGYFAYCPELKGCHTHGNTIDEVLVRLREAVDLYVETLSPDERALLSTKDVVTTTIGVVVPFHSGEVLHPKIVKEVLAAAAVTG